MKVTKIKIESLSQHPVHKSIYSIDIDLLVESIEKLGQLVPIVVNSKNEVISGWLRVCALKKLGAQEVDGIVNTSISVEDETAVIISFNTQRKKSTLEISNEIEALREDFLKRKGKRTDLEENLSPEDLMHTKARIAKEIGISETHVQKITAIKAKDPDKLNLIDSGECSINEVYKMVVEPKPRKSKEPEVKEESNDSECLDVVENNRTTNNNTAQPIQRLYRHTCPRCSYEFN